MGNEHAVAAAASNADFFVSVPNSWLHEFIRCMSAASRLALFRTSRQLARLVVQSAPDVVLKLSRGQPYPITPAQMKSRQEAITALICQGRTITLQVGLKWPKPLTHQICMHVWSLHVLPDTKMQFKWASFTNLQKLTLDTVNEHAQALSDACQAGHLKCLNYLKMTEPWWLSPSTGERMTSALGLQLLHFHCERRFWVHTNLARFTRLQSLELIRCELTKEDIPSLCQHPTLRSLKLIKVLMHNSVICCNDVWFEAQPSWDLLELRSVSSNVLTAFPLASVQRIVLCGATKDDGCSALKEVLLQHAAKLVCAPFPWINGVCNGAPAFSIEGFSSDITQLVKHLHPMCRLLHIETHAKHPVLLSQLWACLPSFVHTICFKGVGGVDIQNLWKSLPVRITTVLFQRDWTNIENEIPVYWELCQTAPSNVRALVL